MSAELSYHAGERAIKAVDGERCDLRTLVERRREGRRRGILVRRVCRLCRGRSGGGRHSREIRARDGRQATPFHHSLLDSTGRSRFSLSLLPPPLDVPSITRLLSNNRNVARVALAVPCSPSPAPSAAISLSLSCSLAFGGGSSQLASVERLDASGKCARSAGPRPSARFVADK